MAMALPVSKFFVRQRRAGPAAALIISVNCSGPFLVLYLTLVLLYL